MWKKLLAVFGRKEKEPKMTTEQFALLCAEVKKSYKDSNYAIVLDFEVTKEDIAAAMKALVENGMTPRKSDDPKYATTDGKSAREGWENREAPAPTKENGQHEAYWVLSEEERTKGFTRPLRRSYIHDKCGTETKMGLALCETYARDPKFYSSTFCCGCHGHFSVSEFKWTEDNKTLGE